MFKTFRHLVVLWLIIIMKKIWCCVTNICACLRQTHSRSSMSRRSASSSKQNFAGIDELGECSRNSPRPSLTSSSYDFANDSCAEESEFTCSDCEVFWLLREQVAAVHKNAMNAEVHTGWILCRIDSQLYVGFGTTPDMLTLGKTVCGKSIHGPTLTEFLRQLGVNRRLLKMDRTEISKLSDKQLITTVKLHTVDSDLENVLFEWLGHLSELNHNLLCQAKTLLKDKSADKDAVVSLTTSRLTCSGYYQYRTQRNAAAKLDHEQRDGSKENQDLVNNHDDCRTGNDEEKANKISSREILIPVCSKHFVIADYSPDSHSPTSTAMRSRKASRASSPQLSQRLSKESVLSLRGQGRESIVNLLSTTQDRQAKQRRLKQTDLPRAVSNHQTEDKDVKSSPTLNGFEQSCLSSASMTLINESSVSRILNQSETGPLQQTDKAKIPGSPSTLHQNSGSGRSKPQPRTWVSVSAKDHYSRYKQTEFVPVSNTTSIPIRQPERVPKTLQSSVIDNNSHHQPSKPPAGTCSITPNTGPSQILSIDPKKQAPHDETLKAPTPIPKIHDMVYQRVSPSITKPKQLVGAAPKECIEMTTCKPLNEGVGSGPAEKMTLKTGVTSKSSKNSSTSAVPAVTPTTIPSGYVSSLDKRETETKTAAIKQSQSSNKPKRKPKTKSATHVSVERLTEPKHARSKSISSVTEKTGKEVYAVGVKASVREGDGDKTDLKDSKVVESMKEPGRVSIVAPKTHHGQTWESAWQNNSINVIGSLIEPKVVKNCESYQVVTADRRNMADIIRYRRRANAQWNAAPATAMETMVASLNNSDIKKSDVKAIWTILSQQMGHSTGLDSLSKSEILRSFDTLRSCKSTSSLIDLKVGTNNSFRQLEPLIFLNQGEALQALNLADSSKQWCRQKQKANKHVTKAGGHLTPKKSSSATTQARTNRTTLTPTIVDKLREARLLTHETDCYGNTATYLEYQVPTDKYVPCTSLQCADDLYQVMPSSLIRSTVLEELQEKFGAIKSRVACVKQFRGCKTSLSQKADLEKNFLQMLESHKISVFCADTAKGKGKSSPKTSSRKFKQTNVDHKNDKSGEKRQKQGLDGGPRPVARTDGKRVATCRMTAKSEKQSDKLPHAIKTQGQKSSEPKTDKCKEQVKKRDDIKSIPLKLAEAHEMFDGVVLACKNSPGPCEIIQWSASVPPKGAEKLQTQPPIFDHPECPFSGAGATQVLGKQTPKKTKMCRKNAVQELAREFANAKEVDAQRDKLPEKQSISDAPVKRCIDSEIIDEKRITRMAVNTDIRLDDAVSCGVKAKRGPRQQEKHRKQKVKTRKNICNLNNLNEFREEPMAQAWIMNNFDLGSSSEEDNTVHVSDEEISSASLGKERSPIGGSVRQEEDIRHQFMAPAKIIGRKSRCGEEDDDLLFVGAKKNTGTKKDRRRRKSKAAH